MANSLEYIEDYFAGNLSEEEKGAFERKCETDPVFAEEVGFYVTLRDNIRRELYNQKRKSFGEMYTQLSSDAQYSLRSDKTHPLLKKLIPYFSIAAVCLVLLIGWVTFFNTPSPQKLASNYVEEQMQTLSITMNGSQDSLQMGIAAFNRKDYYSAEKVFRSLANQETLAPEAVKNLGILYLVTGQYDKAIIAFDSLAANKNLYANPGLFYKAVTLMKRSQGKDMEEAKVILQKVINKRLPGSKEAEMWVKEW